MEKFRLAICCKKSEPAKDTGAPEEKNVTFTTEPEPSLDSRPLPVPYRGPQQRAGETNFVARFDYLARTEEDLSFNTGDALEVLDFCPGGWWMARTLNGASVPRSGFIPANYVAPVRSMEAEPWYFPNTKRYDAEKMLLAKGNRTGAFLIRSSESLEGELVLSVLDQGEVKHYKLLKLKCGHYYISMANLFLTLNELVDYYSKQTNGLCVLLGEPCKKTEVPQTPGLSYNTVVKWEIDRKSITLLKKLGTGQFGDVYEGLWNGTTSVAVKTPKSGRLDPSEFLREAETMMGLRHPKLIQLYAVCTREEPIYIVTELMKNGSLLEYLQKDKGTTLWLLDQIEMAAQVASGMAYLESQNYIHRDLAARNVLVGENNICKVADFGLARVLKSDEENVYKAKDGTKVPIKWTAPEAINEKKFTMKSDVWSFGILLYEIVTFGQVPYPGMSNMQAVQWVTDHNRMSCPPDCPVDLHQIMMDCWKENEQDRPTFKKLQCQLDDFFHTESR